jgi:hypothetical protein
VPTTEKSGPTPATSVATAVIFARTLAIVEAMFVSIARTAARGLRRLSCEPIDRRFESTPTISAATAAIFEQTFAIDVVTFATCDRIAETRAGISEFAG